jgi:hypothetical protein
MLSCKGGVNRAVASALKVGLKHRRCFMARKSPAS